MLCTPVCCTHTALDCMFVGRVSGQKKIGVGGDVQEPAPQQARILRLVSSNRGNDTGGGVGVHRKGAAAELASLCAHCISFDCPGSVGVKSLASEERFFPQLNAPQHMAFSEACSNGLVLVIGGCSLLVAMTVNYHQPARRQSRQFCRQTFKHRTMARNKLSTIPISSVGKVPVFRHQVRSE